jgi:hypothetical protein
MVDKRASEPERQNVSIASRFSSRLCSSAKRQVVLLMPAMGVPVRQTRVNASGGASPTQWVVWIPKRMYSYFVLAKHRRCSERQRHEAGNPGPRADGGCGESNRVSIIYCGLCTPYGIANYGHQMRHANVATTCTPCPAINALLSRPVSSTSTGIVMSTVGLPYVNCRLSLLFIVHRPTLDQWKRFRARKQRSRLVGRGFLSNADTYYASCSGRHQSRPRHCTLAIHYVGVSSSGTVENLRAAG